MEPIYPGIDVPKETIAAFCVRWKIREFALFGSAARKELRPDSDIDVMLKFDEGAPWGLWDVVDMQDELKTIFQRDVDIVTGEIVNPFRRRTMMRDLAVVYAA